MARYTKYYQNMQIVKEGFEMYLKEGAGSRKLMKGLRKTQAQVVKVMEDMIKAGEQDPKDPAVPVNTDCIPVYTGNLVNSLGVGIYKNSRLIAYAPVAVKTATNPPHVQSVGAAANRVRGVTEYNINGAALLDYTRNNETQGEQSYAITLFATVPYAAYINEFGAAPKGHWGGSGGRGKRFFSKLSKELILALGRNVFRHNKNILDYHYSYT